MQLVFRTVPFGAGKAFGFQGCRSSEGSELSRCRSSTTTLKGVAKPTLERLGLETRAGWHKQVSRRPWDES